MKSAIMKNKTGLAREARTIITGLLPFIVLLLAGPAFGQMAPPGNALTFDGVDEYVSVPDDPSLRMGTGSFTIEGWIRSNGALAQDATIFHKGDTTDDTAYGVRMFATGGIRGGLQNWDQSQTTFTTYGAGTQYDDGLWHHVAMVVDRTADEQRMYVDGVQIGTTTNIAAFTDAMNPDDIGNIGRQEGGATYANAQIDEVRVWTVARTQAEIRSTMYESLAGTEPGLVAYYDFDQSNPDVTLVDRAGGDNNGNLTNMEPLSDWVASGALLNPPGYALDFDGTDDYVAPTFFNRPLPMTITAWVRPQSAGNSIVGWSSSANTGGAMLSIEGSGNLRYGEGNSVWCSNNALSTATIPIGEWTHVAVTLDAARNATLYINGMQDGSSGGPLDQAPGGMDYFHIGAWYNISFGIYRYFDGEIDEVRIWNQVRSQNDIQNDMHNTIDPAGANLEAYYRFDHTSGGTLIDLTANAHDGALSGGPIWTPSEAMCPFANPPTDITPTGFTAGWDAVNGATGYRIDVDDDPLFGSPEVDDLDAGAVTSYAVTTPLAGGTVWYYRVRAERSGWTSPSSAPMEVMPPPGYALDFDGADDYADIRDGVVFNGNFSVEGWVYVRSYNYFSRLICFGNGEDANNVIFGLSEGTSGQPYFEIIETVGQRCASPTPIPLNTWTHLAASLDGTTGQLFINGTEVAVQAGMEIPANVTRVNNYIGRSNYVADAYANAIFDEIRIWNDVRTQQEIRDNMNNTVDPASGGLVACYRFDHTDGNILPDLTASGNRGELVNMDPVADWVSSGAFNVWTGAVDTDWNTAGNWSMGTVPVATDNVAIPAGLGDPVVAGGFAYCNHLTVATGANLVLNNDDLRVTGNIHNSGSITSPGAGGYLVCSGSSAQYVQGGTIEKIAINNAAGVVLESDLTVADALTMTTGAITANGNTISYGAGAVLAYLGAAPQTSSDAEFPATNGPDYLTIINSAGVALHAGRTVTNLYLSDGQFDTGGNVLAVNGNITVNTGSFATGSDVTFGGAGASTDLPAGTYGNVEINRANGIGLGGDVAIDGTLTLTDGPVTLGAANLTLGPAAAIGGVPSGANMVVTDGAGELRRVIPGPGTFVYPVGDAMGNYSPVELGFTGGTFVGDYAGVVVANTAHPDNTSATNYLNRYWTVTSGIANFSCDATFTYVNGDIVGTEADIYGGKWDGGWTLLGPVNAGTNEINATVSFFGDFTGGEMTALEMDAPGYLQDFDGADDYVVGTPSTLPSGNNAYTWETWIYWPGTTGFTERILAWGTPNFNNQYTGIRLIEGTGTIGIDHWNNDWDTGYALPANTWVHLCGTYDGNDVESLYANGVLEAQRVGMADLAVTSAEFTIGSNLTGQGGGFFGGSVDEMRIWNGVRTELQIRDNMNSTVDPFAPGLLAYYRFDQTSGTTLYDLTGNGNDGTLNGPAWADSDAFNVWTGAVDTDWHNADNWSDGVPGVSDNVSIPAGLGNYPVAGMDAYCNHLTAAAGASVAAGLDQYLYVSGNIYNNGTITGTGNWLLVCNGNSPQYLQIGTVENIEINNNAGVVLESDDLIVSGILWMTDGTITLNGQLVTYLPGAALGYPGPFGPGTPQTTSDAEFPAVNGPTDLYVMNPAGVTLHAGRTLSGSVNIAPGSELNSGGFDLNVGGAWANDGTFTPGAGTVYLNGTAQAVLGSTTFNNLVKTTAAADTLWFEAGSTLIVTGTLTLQGTAGNLLTIQSNGSPTQWNIDPQGTRNIAYLEVRDSNNINALVVDATGTNSISSGNNTNWNFEAPVAADDAYNVNEDAELNEAVPGVLSNDTDADLDPLTAVLDTDVSNGVLTLNPDGSFEYTPDQDFFGTDTFTYHANDGYGDSNIVTVTITVDPVNDQPGFTATDPPAVNEEAGTQNVSGWASGFDPGNTYESAQAVLAYNVSGVGNPGLFSVQPAVDTAGTLTYTPAPDATGTSVFGVTVQDNEGTPNGGTDTSVLQTFTITVNDVNDQPDFTASNPPSVLEDAGAQTVAGWVTAFDPGAANETGQGVLEYVVSNIGNASLFTAGPAVDASGTLTYTPLADAFGTSTFDVAVRDNGGTANGGSDTSASRTFTITIEPVNDPPGFTAANPGAVPEDAGPQTVSGWITAFDPGNAFESGQAALAYNVANIADPSLFAVQPAVDSSGTLTFTPADGAFGLSTFDVAVQDNGGTTNGGTDISAVQTFVIDIGEINDPPVIAEGSAVSVDMDEDREPSDFSLPLNAIDPDPVPAELTWSISSQAANGLASVDGSDTSAQIGYVPDYNFAGTDSFIVRVTDDQMWSEITVTVTVNPVNDAPSLDTSGYMLLNPIVEDVPDADNPGTSVSAIISSAGGDRITDPDDGAEEGIAVIATNENSGQWQYDHDGDGIFNYFPFDLSETAALLLNGQAMIRFVPYPDFNGTVNPGITFRAWDLTSGASGDTGVDTAVNGGSTAFSAETETAMIGVNTGADSPVILQGENVTVEMDEDGTPVPFSLTLEANDSDGDVLTWDILYQPQNGIAGVAETGMSVEVSYTPDEGFSGTDAFTVRVSDGTNVALTRVSVIVNESPYEVAFNAEPRSGMAPLEVEFFDRSEGAEEWLWDFGDGNQSTEQNPIHTYTSSGAYSVTLTISGSWGRRELTKTNCIEVDPMQIEVAITGWPRSGIEPLEVSFEHESPDAIDGFSWDFGDGGLSSDPNPVHVFEKPGFYTIRLNVTGPKGEGYAENAAYVEVLPTRGINGRVTAADTGAPLPGTLVYVWLGDEIRAYGYTEEDGYFSFGGLEPSEDYVLEARPPEQSGYLYEFYNGKDRRDEADRVSLAIGDASEVHFTLLPKTETGIRGRVTGNGGNGVYSANVSLISPSADFSANVFTDANGFYEALDLPEAGDYIVSSRGESGIYYYFSPNESVFFWDRAVRVAAGDPPSENVNIVMNPEQGAFLSGHVYSSSGDPLSGILVNASSNNGSSGFDRTESDGAYTIWGLEDVPAGMVSSDGYLVEIWTSGYPYQAFELTDSSEAASRVETGRTDIDFTLKTGSAISGTVTDSDGNPVPDVRVSAWSPTGEEGSALSSSVGAYNIPNLEAADGYVVAAFPDDYPVQYYNRKPNSSGADTVDLSGGDAEGVNFVLDRGAVISGVIRLDDGTPVPEGIMVRVWSDSTQTGGSVLTDADGMFEMFGLDPDADDYVVSVVDPQWQPAYHHGEGTVGSWEDANRIPAGGNADLTLTPGYGIRGLVTADGAPVAGVRVEVSVPGGRSVYATTSEDAPGGFNFEITGVAPGIHTINLSSETYGNQVLYDIVVEGDTVIPAVVMSRGPSRTISGEVEGLETGREALVHAWSRTADFSKVVTVFGNGGAVSYSIDGLAAAADYRVEIKSGDYAYQVWDHAGDWEYAKLVDVSENDAEGVDFQLVPSDGLISGTVTFPAGASPGDTARIVVSSGTAGSDGTDIVYEDSLEVAWSVGGLAIAEDYAVSVDSAGYPKRFYDGSENGASDEVEALFVGTGTAGVDIALVSGANVSGTVSGDGLEGVRAEAWSDSLGSGGGAPVGAGGEFVVEGLDPADDYVVYVGKSGLPPFHYHPDGTVMFREQAARIAVPASGINIVSETGESIAGTVTDRSGSPIGGVWVRAWSESKKSGNGMFTAQDGTYKIEGLPTAMDYTVFAEPEWASGFENQELRNISAGTESIYFMLGKRDGSSGVTGTIRDARGDHIPNVEVELRSESKGVHEWFVTSRSGSRDLHVRNLYEFKALPESGDYVITARPPSDSPHAFYMEKDVLIAGETTFNIVLKLGSAIRGTVRKWDGEERTPLAGVWVTAYSPEKEFLGEAWSGPDGSYTVSNVPYATDYVVIARKDGFFEERLVGERPGRGIDFVLSQSGAIWGEVRDRHTGRPLAGATVQIHSQYMIGLGSFSGAGTTDGEGRYRIGGLKYEYRDLVSNVSQPVTDYTATVSAEGYPPVSMGGLEPGERADFLMVAGTKSLFGTASGVGADLIVLDIFENMGDHVKSVRLEDGAFDVADLPDDEYQLRLTAYMGDETIAQWAGENDLGFDEIDPENNPENAKVYTLPAEIDFRFTAGRTRSARSTGGPGLVRGLRSTSHTDWKETGVRQLASNAAGIVSSNPNITVTWEPTHDDADEEYLYVFNREPDFAMTRRTAPKEQPIRVRRATGPELAGDDIPFWCHVAAVDNRGRIGATGSLRFQIDTVPPSNAVVSRISDSADGYATLSLGATGAVEMYISNLGFGVGGAWEKWTATREWKLPETGSDEFFVRFRDRAKNTVNAMPLTETVSETGLTVSASAGPNGTIAPAGTISVEQGDSLSFRITPDTGYDLDAFLVGGAPADGLANSYPSYVFRLNDIQNDTTVSTTFREVWHSIIATAGANGSIEPFGEMTLRKDSDASFQITPDPGYKIGQLLVNGVPATPADGNKLRLINITEDFAVNVTFEKE